MWMDKGDHPSLAVVNVNTSSGWEWKIHSEIKEKDCGKIMSIGCSLLLKFSNSGTLGRHHRSLVTRCHW